MTPRAPMESAMFPARQEGGEREISQEAARAMLAALRGYDARWTEIFPRGPEQARDCDAEPAGCDCWAAIRAAIALAEGRAS